MSLIMTKMIDNIVSQIRIIRLLTSNRGYEDYLGEVGCPQEGQTFVIGITLMKRIFTNKTII